MRSLKYFSVIVLLTLFAPSTYGDENPKKKKRNKAPNSVQAARLPKWPDPNLKVVLPTLGKQAPDCPSDTALAPTRLG